MLAGYSLARFQRTNLFQGKLAQVAWTTLPGVILAYYAVVVPYAIVKGPIDPLWLLFLGNFLPHTQNLIEPLWFIPAYVQIVLMFLALFAVPQVRAFLATDPWRGGLLMLGAASATFIACDLVIDQGILLFRLPLSLFHLFALGWCIRHADTQTPKVVVSLLAMAIVGGFWAGSVPPAALISAGCLALIWIDEVRLPRRVAHAGMAMGAASFYIYVMHVLPAYALAYAFHLDRVITTIPAYLVITGIAAALGVATYLAVNRGSALVVTAAGRLTRRKYTAPTPHQAAM